MWRPCAVMRVSPSSASALDPNLPGDRVHESDRLQRSPRARRARAAGLTARTSGRLSPLPQIYPVVTSRALSATHSTKRLRARVRRALDLPKALAPAPEARPSGDRSRGGRGGRDHARAAADLPRPRQRTDLRKFLSLGIFQILGSGYCLRSRSGSPRSSPCTSPGR